MANQTSCLIIQTSGGLVIVREIDGVPSFSNIDILEVPNGTLSQPAAGTARIEAISGRSVTLGFKGQIIGGGLAEQYLSVVEKTITLNNSFVLPSASVLRAMTISVDFASANEYTLDVIVDPTGRVGPGPIILGTASLILAAGARTATVSGLSIPVSLDLELGARMRLTSGAGNSAPLRSMIAFLEFSPA